MEPEEADWDSYYQKTQGRPPRGTLIGALERFPTDGADSARQAIDLGCGDGTDTLELLRRGWRVLAIDGQPSAIEGLLEKVPAAQRDRLETQVATFEAMSLIPADLIFAGFTIPFCDPGSFDDLWWKIETAVVPGGRFAGHFFGPHDSWADRAEMTFHTAEQVQGMLATFEVEVFKEIDEDGQSSVGDKHWHIFEVVARKR